MSQCTLSNQTSAKEIRTSVILSKDKKLQKKENQKEQE